MSKRACIPRLVAKFVLPACIIIGAVAPNVATAATLVTVSYPPQAATPESGASVGSGVGLPTTGNPAFTLNFVLPRDYQPNGTVYVVLYLVTGVGPCRARIVPTGLRRSRVGLQQADGLSGVSSTASVPLANLVVAQRIITIQPSSGMPGQNALDGFQLKIARLDDAGDTCNGNVLVEHIDIQYPVP